MQPVDRAAVEKIIAAHGLDLSAEKMLLVGIRGPSGANQVGVFDDVLAWIDATTFETYRGNADPTREKPHVANLRAGVWLFEKGTHHGSFAQPFPAYVQAAPVTVLRYVDGKRWQPDTGMFAIHIHKNHKENPTSTSSLGCQTVVWDRWDHFKAQGDLLMANHGISRFKYLLVDWA